MKALSPNWFSQGILDPEYKRYILLAYLQHVDEEYKQTKVFPVLQQLASNATAMKDFTERCEELSSSFPKEISGFDQAKGQLTYKSKVQDPELLMVINEILDYSIPKVEEKINQGKELYNSAESMIELEPLGILPIYKNEGYLITQNDANTPDNEVYRFKLSLIRAKNTSFKLETEFLKKTKRTIAHTFYQIKDKLIKDFNELPNPATFIAISKNKLPRESTFLPIAKRLLLKNLTQI